MRVRAVDVGYYGAGMQGCIRNPGDEFELTDDSHFSDADVKAYSDEGNGIPVYGWMEKIEDLPAARPGRVRN